MKQISKEDQITLMAVLLSEGVDVTTLPKDMQARVATMSQFITATVGFLATLHPNERINTLMTCVWALVGTHYVRPALGPSVPTVSFASVGPQARIFLPHNWLEMIAKDIVMQSASLVFVGSQVLDHWNGKITCIEDAVALRIRASAYEAEFLLAMELGFKPNTYQQLILETYPQGLDTPSVAKLLYESKPVPDHSPFQYRA